MLHKFVQNTDARYAIGLITGLTLLLPLIVTVEPQLFSFAQISNNSGGNNGGDEARVGTFDADSNPYGLSYGEWTAKWWQWAYSMPKDINPAYDDTGKYCAANQKGPVWFFAGSYGKDVARQCSVPSDKAILFPILNSECSFAEFPALRNGEQLRQCAKEIQDSVTQLKASVDGKNIANLNGYRVQSPIFNFKVTENNILGLPPQTTEAVSDGNWVFLRPLPEGQHSISFKGDLKNISDIKTNGNGYAFAVPFGWDNNVTYHLTVADATNAATKYPSYSPGQTGGQYAIKPDNKTRENGNSNDLYLLSESIENRLEKAAALLEITGALPEVKNVSHAHMLNKTIEQLKGIPQNGDIPKRQVAKDILEKYGDFQVVFFLMPNGDMYIEEPYSRQENLTKTNFAFRDYYKGAINNHDTFLGNVIVSASSGQNQAVMAVPIYSGGNGSLVGIWAGGLDLGDFKDTIQSLNLTDNERIVYVDGVGQVVADSVSQSPNQNVSFANLKGFKNAINGNSGTVKEMVNGTEMLVSYHPIKAISSNWAVLLMQPVNGSSVAPPGTLALNNAGIIENGKQVQELLLQNTSGSKPSPR
jgi:hypothetical protein